MIDDVQRSIAYKLQETGSEIKMKDYIETCKTQINKRIDELHVYPRKISMKFVCLKFMNRRSKKFPRKTVSKIEKYIALLF